MLTQPGTRRVGWIHPEISSTIVTWGKDHSPHEHGLGEEGSADSLFFKFVGNSDNRNQKFTGFMMLWNTLLGYLKRPK